MCTGVIDFSKVYNSRRAVPSGRHFKSPACESGKWLSTFLRNPQMEFFGSTNGDIPGLTIADCSETDK